MSNILLARGIAQLLDDCIKLQAGESVVIVTDTNKEEIARDIAFAAHERGAEVTLTVMTPRRWHGEEPPGPVAEAMKSAAVALLPTTYSMTHSDARRAATNNGCRILTLPGYCEELFCDGSLEVDFSELSTLIEAMGEQMSAAKEARFISANGSILTIPLAGRPSINQTGLAYEPGTLAAPPALETAVSPLEGATFGTLTVDGVVVPGGLVTEPFVVYFQDGRIVNIEGGNDAMRFKDLLEGYDDPNMFCPVELGIGMNPKAKMGREIIIEDEVEFGSGHIGLGEGRGFGSSIKAKAHMDLVMKAPTLEVDGKIILQNKEFIIGGHKYKLDKGGGIECLD